MDNVDNLVDNSIFPRILEFENVDNSRRIVFFFVHVFLRKNQVCTICLKTILMKILMVFGCLKIK